MSTSVAAAAGIDISKDHLDVATHPGGQARRFASDKGGHTALLRWIEPMTVAGAKQTVAKPPEGVLARFGALLAPECRPPRSEALGQRAERRRPQDAGA